MRWMNKLDQRVKESMYRPIKDYAIIGDTHTAALISSHGSIDWACLPHFDSAAVFLRLLDHDQGGYCVILPSKTTATSRRYLERTNILETTFRTDTGVLVVLDFMPIRKRKEPHPTGQDVISEHRIIRLLRCAAGSVECLVEIAPTFSFAAEKAEIISSGNGKLVFKGRSDALHVSSPKTLTPGDGRASATVRLKQGYIFPLVLTYSRPDEQIAPLLIEANIAIWSCAAPSRSSFLLSSRPAQWWPRRRLRFPKRAEVEEIIEDAGARPK